jgi:capsid portal protein
MKRETQRCKFVTLIDGKEVWFTFYVMVEMKTYG